MNEERARQILGDMVRPDNRLHDPHAWVKWPDMGRVDTIEIDCSLTVEDLEAIAWWMRNMKVTGADT